MISFKALYFIPFLKSKSAAELRNKLEHDDMTAATYELDDDPEVLQRSMDNLDFPVLKSNTNVSQENFWPIN